MLGAGEPKLCNTGSKKADTPTPDVKCADEADQCYTCVLDASTAYA